MSLTSARELLREEQRKAAFSSPGHGGEVTALALDRYRDLTAVTGPDPGTGRLRRGAFSYRPELENARIAHGRALIDRVAPGPHEDPFYFAMLAYQAASVELAYDAIGVDEQTEFLIGTAHSSLVNAFAVRQRTGDQTVVVLNSGLIDFVYQSAKVVIEALGFSVSPEGHRGVVEASTDPESVRERLSADPHPIERLYRTLEAYYFNGYPRAFTNEEVALEQHPPLAMIVALAERWIIAHEYGHGLAPAGLGSPAGGNASWTEEFFADTNAMVCTVMSAAKFDAVPPEFPLGGALFSLKCLDVLARAHYLLLTGEEPGPAALASPTHPAPRDRAVNVIRSFRTMFDVAYNEPAGTGFDVWFMNGRTEAPVDHSFTADNERHAHVHADILEMVWAEAKLRFEQDWRQGRPLHAMWQ